MDMSWMKTVKEYSAKGIESLKTMKQDKKEYKEFQERVKKLPRDYQVVYEEVSKFLWQFATGDGMDMVHLTYDLVEFFEEGAANETPVLELIGGDVGQFAEGTLHEFQAKTWIDQQKEKMNQRVAEKLRK
jgi:DNA-binding ferritin-like protein (Dps family)